MFFKKVKTSGYVMSAIPDVFNVIGIFTLNMILDILILTI